MTIRRIEAIEISAVLNYNPDNFWLPSTDTDMERQLFSFDEHSDLRGVHGIVR